MTTSTLATDRKSKRGGKRAGAGRPPTSVQLVKASELVDRAEDAAKAAESSVVNIELEVGRFREDLRTGLMRTIWLLSNAAPDIARGLIEKSLPRDEHGILHPAMGNLQAQMFVMEKMLKFVQPDFMVVGETTPVDAMWQKVHDYIMTDEEATDGDDSGNGEDTLG